MGKKRGGQVSIYMVISIVVLLLVLIGFLIFNTVTSNQLNDEALTEDFEPIDSYIMSFLSKSINEAIREVALEGGVGQGDYKIYNNTNYNYHCNSIEGIGCINNLISRKKVEDYLLKKVHLAYQTYNYDPLRKQGFDIENTPKTFDIKLEYDTATITMFQEINAELGNKEYARNEYTYRSPLKIGKLFSLANHILNEEIKNSHFNEDAWMRMYSETYIYKHQPYPDTVYSLVIDKGLPTELIFNFAIQGEDIASNPKLGLQKRYLLGVCKSNSDNMCFYNIQKSSCPEGFTWQKDGNNLNCEPVSNYKFRESERESCSDMVNGESRCVYDGIVGNGFDSVGSRHFKETCINGEIIHTECKDYREEICVEVGEKNAVCRDNRWEDCASQTNSQSCNNKNDRDCYWVDYLDNSISDIKMITSKCSEKST